MSPVGPFDTSSDAHYLVAFGGEADSQPAKADQPERGCSPTFCIYWIGGPTTSMLYFLASARSVSASAPCRSSNIFSAPLACSSREERHTPSKTLGLSPA